MKALASPPSGIPGAIVATSTEDLQPPPGTTGLLFDLDGTLVDSERANLAAYNAALQDLGLSITAGWFRKRFGLPGPVVLDQVRRGWALNFDLDTYVERKNRAYLELASNLRAFPETAGLLRTEAPSHPTAVVTSGPRVTAAAVLAATGLAPFVDVVVSRDDVSSTKPSPEPYLLGAARLEVDPHSCLVYEDTNEGIEAGTAAGMRVIDVRPLLSERRR